MGSHPFSIEPWQERTRSEKVMIVFLTFIQATFLPLFFTWVWYFVLFPVGKDREHFGAMMFYIAMPMTFVGFTFMIVYFGVNLFIARNPKQTGQ
jgi:ABC-type transport system involved in multi-copper enzyme maturation permease subunit